MERFPIRSTCPACAESTPLLAVSAAGFTYCPACRHAYALSARVLADVARVALLNLPRADALALLDEARDVFGMSAPAPLREILTSDDLTIEEEHESEEA